MKGVKRYFKKPFTTRTPAQYNRMLAGLKRKYGKVKKK